MLRAACGRARTHPAPARPAVTSRSCDLSRAGDLCQEGLFCTKSSGWWPAARPHACQIPTGARGEAGRGVYPSSYPLPISKVAGPLTRRPAPARWCTRRSRAWRRPRGGRRRRMRRRARSPRRRRCPCACAPLCPRCRPTARPATWRAPSRRAPRSAPRPCAGSLGAAAAHPAAPLRARARTARLIGLFGSMCRAAAALACLSSPRPAARRLARQQSRRSNLAATPTLNRGGPRRWRPTSRLRAWT